MPYEQIVEHYLEELNDCIQEAERTGQMTPELSYRPILDTFLRSMADDSAAAVSLIFEPKRQGQYGRPDWRVYHRETLGLVGYVEAKALDPERPIDHALYSDQITRYLRTGHCVMLTDGLEFLFFSTSDGEPSERITLVQKPWAGGGADANPLLERRILQFFQDVGPRECTEQQLIRDVALRARMLSGCIAPLLDAPRESGRSESENAAIDLMHSLSATFSEHHDPILADSKAFADFVSQVLVFGLLYAHRVVTGPEISPQEVYEAIGRFWADVVYSCHADRLIPFKTLVSSLVEAPDSPIAGWYDDTRRLLAFIELEQDATVQPDYHSLFEDFLKEFDPETRFEFGAFYTPRELAFFMVGLSKSIIEQRFGGRKLFQNGNKAIDPCCGTGTFVEELVRFSIDEAAIEIVGFEILPGPYALAHYRVAMIDFQGAPQHDIGIYLANTLSDGMVEDDGEAQEHELRQEIDKARLAAELPLVLAIGNPPSSDDFGPHSTGDRFRVIHEMLNDFRPPASERTSRQNVQRQVGNDFMKFLRWSSQQILEGGNGLLAVVVPSSFATHESYEWARKWLVDRFSEIWVLSIDRDLRTGVNSSSLFDSRQGRIALFALCTQEGQQTRCTGINYASLLDKTRSQKREFLGCERNQAEYLEAFNTHQFDDDTCSFLPARSEYDQDLYARFWAIYEPSTARGAPDERFVFLRHCSGVKLAPTAVFIHPHRPLLQRRSREIADLSRSFDSILGDWFSGQRKPPRREKLTNEIRDAIGTASNINESFRGYSFRPFLFQHVLYDASLLSMLQRIGGGGTRPRPEVEAAYSSEDTIGVAIAPSPLDIGAELHRFTTFCWDMPDNDLCARGNAHVFCNQFPELMTRRGDWDNTLRSNISEALLEQLRKVLPSVTDQDVVFYVYAVLCSSVLLDAFADAYYKASSSSSAPRIPVIKDKKYLRRLIRLGRLLARYENPQVDWRLQQWVQDLQGLMGNPFQLRSYRVDEEKGQIKLLDQTGSVRVFLSDLPAGILSIRISGYPVIDCWLKFHSYNYTRAEFSADGFAQLLRTISALDYQLSLVKLIDEILEEVFAGAIELM